MDAIEFLKDYASSVDPLVENIFTGEIVRAKNISKYSDSPYKKYLDFMRGGKKIRGALATLGYYSVGGKDRDAILGASVAIEVIQSFLLIHDDFVDRDELRRGKKTIHLQFRDELANVLSSEESLHFGNSFAVFTGDMGMFLAIRIIANSDFPSDLKLKALASLSEYLILTADGELLDVREGFTLDLTMEQVYNARVLKTAYYSVVMPLVFGARLGGGDEGSILAMKDYGKNVGLAFQIQDDILGIFSSEEEIGKDIAFDIFDGKKTLLFLTAMNRAGRIDKDYLVLHYGKGKISVGEIEKVKQIFVETGALELAKSEAVRLVAEGKKKIPQITNDEESRKLLSGIADFMISRTK